MISSFQSFFLLSQLNMVHYFKLQLNTNVTQQKRKRKRNRTINVAQVPPAQDQGITIILVVAARLLIPSRRSFIPFDFGLLRLWDWTSSSFQLARVFCGTKKLRACSHGDHQSPEDYDPTNCTFTDFPFSFSLFLVEFLFAPFCFPTNLFC